MRSRPSTLGKLPLRVTELLPVDTAQIQGALQSREDHERLKHRMQYICPDQRGKAVLSRHRSLLDEEMAELSYLPFDELLTSLPRLSSHPAVGQCPP